MMGSIMSKLQLNKFFTMRPIEFRGYSLSDKQWKYWYYYVNTLGMHNIVCPDGMTYEVDPGSVGQYIWRDDKNGTKIFEWDCVCWGRDTHIIHMYQWAFMLSSIPNKLAVSNKVLSIIGNKYEAMQQIPSHLLQQ